VRTSARNNRRRGRVEAALDQELLDHRELGKAERAALRAQAYAVDLAEQLRDPDRITTANGGYLNLRQAAGLTLGGQTQPEDAFGALLAELSKPGAGTSDTAPAQ
jgi:hypothetical protein